MKVLNQDKDRFYNIIKVFYKSHSYQGILFGWNIYGTNANGRNFLLGTRDTEQEALQITNEITALMDKGVDKYSIPELIEDIEIEIEIEKLEGRLC